MDGTLNGYKRIEDYGVIGDLNTVALVGIDGSIDFLCFPRFDSPSIFAALLDRHRGGRFQIAPVGHVERHRQMYFPDSNVLLTRFLSNEGVTELSDFMPVEEVGYAHNLVRMLRCVRGPVTVRVVCEPRFDYARATHKASARDGHILFISDGPDRTALRLTCSRPLELKDGAAVAEFTLQPGEQVSFILEDAAPGEGTPTQVEGYVEDAFTRTVDFWRRWIGKSTYHGRWREMVNRSALVLKLLTSQEYGSIVAAPTFGLPEQVGGQRNWDYRYTWIRDASFTLYALSRLGFEREAGDFNRWLIRHCGGGGAAQALQIMYGIDGRRSLEETELSHLEGYRGSRPVRIGNAAYAQVQLDIYGELLDSIYLFDKYGDPMHYELWRDLTPLVDWVADHWTQSDEGIWEVRGGPQQFLYSRVLCWVALDRALRLCLRRSLPGNLDRWRRARDAIYREVFENLWDEQLGAFVQAKGSKTLDASALIMPLVRFVSPTDPRWLSTLRAIERNLVEDSLVYRYRTADGIAGGEGTFSICTFWYVESLSRSGELDRARFIFEKMLAHANHLGLYSEELGPCGEHLGNFPQAFTHLALISAAFDLDRRLSAAGRPG